MWWRVWIPAGITFSALSVLLDEITACAQSSAFCFSIHQQLDLYEATEEKPLAPGGFHYDAQEASSTYIDDYFDRTKRFSYVADGLQASIEVEKVFADGAIPAPMLVKTTAQTDGAAVNERLTPISHSFK
ncbi:MAG: hypothetical protein IJT41_03650 [Clostridia bacterium]|nr:hypothetical protein [Clostridia bacterium]